MPRGENQSCIAFVRRQWVVQHCTISDSLLKKKYASIAYHKTRESAAAGIVHPIKIAGANNFVYLLMKAITGRTLRKLYGGLTRG